MVNAKKAEAKQAHVLDVGSGTGLFAMMAAKAGADSVVANDLSEVLCATARRVWLSHSRLLQHVQSQHDKCLLNPGRMKDGHVLGMMNQWLMCCSQ